uniref:Uncharacterized protein n=1 Tax=Nothobranchius furzeri TaxID=105023 RepID=A0A1A7ZJK9_NOTFU
MMDHDYNLSALREACDEDVVEDIEASEPNLKDQKVNWDHIPVRNKKAKKMKVQELAESREEDVPSELRALNQKIDEQTELSTSFDKRIEANKEAASINRKDISELQSKINTFQKENAALRSARDDHAHYKRR